MLKIDLNTWKRQEHFLFFKTMPYPIYNICFDVDVTKVKDFSSKNALSFNLAMVHISTASLNAIDNFKYRIRGEEVIRHDTLTPSFADMEKDSDLFKMVTIPFEDDIQAFERHAKEKAKNQSRYFVPADFANRDDFVFYSAIPWITFTSIDHTVNLKRDDAIPRISWGKYYKKDDRLFMPYNIQVNHMFVDGIHLGLFNEQLIKRIHALDKLPA